VKISCPACAAKYSIADEKVQDKLAKIRCRKCGTTIVIDGKVSPPSVYAGDASASQAEQPQPSNPNAGIAPGEYSVDLGDNDQRTMTMDALVDAYNTGVVTAETYVWTEGMDDWLPLGQVPAIVDALHAASSPAAAAPEPEPEPAAEPPVSAGIASSEIASQGPWEQSPSMESPSAIRAAAKPGGGRGSTADLFGSFESAGSEAEVSTSAPRATPAPTPAPVQQAASAPAAAGAGGTGARNESSVLFSLSALTASAGSVSAAASSTTATSSGSTSATKEDSGLIDLKALTAAADAPAAAPVAPLTPSPLGMAPPLGLAPPLGGGVEAQIAMPTAMPQKSRTGLYIGGGIVVAALAIAGAIVATSSKPEPPPAPTVAATAPPPPTATAAPTKTEEETTAKPPATGTAEEEKKTAPKVATGGKRPTSTKTSGGTSTKTSGGTSGGTTSKPAATSKPKPSSGGCGCAPGDLQCAMRCAAKGG